MQQLALCYKLNQFKCNSCNKCLGIIPPKQNEAVVTEEQIEDIVENVVKEYTSSKGGKTVLSCSCFFYHNYCHI